MKHEELSLQKYIKSFNNKEYNDKLDDLYQKSKEGYNFYNLLDLILSKENILTALKILKEDKKSSIRRKDGKNISDIGVLKLHDVIKYLRFILLENDHGYRPKPTEIVKTESRNFGVEYVQGMPCIWDKLIQQAVKQIIEPICEGKFSNNSFGHRPSTNIENALASYYKLLQIQKCHFVVEININSFFEGVNHSILKKKIWNIGIRDKKVIGIISRILSGPLRYPDNKVKFPKEGVIQCGLLTSLLTNIYLHEFDKWIDSQWQEHPIAAKYAIDRRAQGKGIDKGTSYKKMRKTNLKEIYLVRYDNQIRLFAKSYVEAKKILEGSRNWFNSRLDLKLSKPSIVNTEKNFSNFLGYKIKLRQKGKKYTVESHMSNYNYDMEKHILDNQIKRIIKHPNKSLHEEIKKYNLTVIEIQKHYQFATDIQLDLSKMQWCLMKQLRNRVNGGGKGIKLKSTGRNLTDIEKKLFGKSKQLKYVYWKQCKSAEPIYPIGVIKTKYPMCRKSNVKRYKSKK